MVGKRVGKVDGIFEDLLFGFFVDLKVGIMVGLDRNGVDVGEVDGIYDGKHVGSFVLGADEKSIDGKDVGLKVDLRTASEIKFHRIMANKMGVTSTIINLYSKYINHFHQTNLRL
jgi:hypothetical protein